MLKKICQKLYQQRFCLPKLKSPTYYNLDRYLKELGWLSTRYNWLSRLNEQHFQFDSLASEHLEFKHLLADLVGQHCPHIMPETYNINDQNWSSVLNHIAHKYYSDNNQALNINPSNIKPLDKKDKLAWILKPALMNNGQHIKIFQDLTQIKNHYQSTNRLGGEHVLQQYISQPHLLRGHKYSIRMFMVITNYAGACVYPYGYFNVAIHPYQVNEFSDLRSHITNEHLSHEASNVIQIPSQRMDIFTSIYPQIKTILIETMNGLKSIHPEAFVCKMSQKRSLAIFGFDFMVDADMRAWLLEANHGPCFPTSNEHPLQSHLYYDFWQALITSFVVPIAKNQPIEQIQYQAFEPI